MLPAPVLAMLMLVTAIPVALVEGDPGRTDDERNGARLTGRVIVEQRIVVRVPRLSPNAITAASMMLPRPVIWIEQGPKCIALGTLAGALITRPDSVDLVSAGGGRVRAHLDDECPALDFYSGFYLKPTKDGKICADRDSVRSRAGRKCGIDRFGKLVPAR